MHVLHPTPLEWMKGALCATELEQDNTETEDVSPHTNVPELPDASQQHLRDRILVGGGAALDVGGAIHPARIKTQRRTEIADLHHRLLRARGDEEVPRLHVTVDDVLAGKPSLPPQHPVPPTGPILGRCS